MKKKRARKLTLLFFGLIAAGFLALMASKYWLSIVIWRRYPKELSLLRLMNESGHSEFRHERSGLTMVLIPGGSFKMGNGRTEDAPSHTVRLSPYLIAKYELSQADWIRFRRVPVPPFFFAGAKLPAINVYNDECQTVCERVGLTLPTEAQWEFAALGTTRARFGLEPDAGPWNVDAGDSNSYGLRNMMGNAWEWCRDPYSADAYRKRGTDAIDPLAKEGKGRVVRGGSWMEKVDFVQRSTRSSRSGGRYFNVGLRPVCEFKELDKAKASQN